MLINAVAWASEQALDDENLLDRLLALITSNLGPPTRSGVGS